MINQCLKDGANRWNKGIKTSRLVCCWGLTLRNLYRRNVNQLVSIFSATDSVLTHTDRKEKKNKHNS